MSHCFTWTVLTGWSGTCCFMDIYEKVPAPKGWQSKALILDLTLCSQTAALSQSPIDFNMGSAHTQNKLQDWGFGVGPVHTSYCWA